MKNAKQYFTEQLVKGYACTIVIYFINDILHHGVYSTSSDSKFDILFENLEFIHYRALGNIKNAIPMFTNKGIF